MSKDKPRDIGVDVEAPANPWDGDSNDPFFGTLPQDRIKKVKA